MTMDRLDSEAHSPDAEQRPQSAGVLPSRVLRLDLYMSHCLAALELVLEYSNIGIIQ